MAGKYLKREKRSCICGTRLGPENFGICKRCTRETSKNPPQNEIRRERTRLRNLRVCRGCGVEFSDRCRSYCTDECRSSHSSKPVEVDCGWCGKKIWKHFWPSEQIHKARFCSCKCQRSYRTKLSHDSVRKKMDWLKKSKKAKVEWKRKHSEERRDRSAVFGWFRLISERLTRISCAKKVDSKGLWENKIRSRMACRGTAECVVQKYTSTTIQKELLRICAKEQWHKANPWKKIIGNKLSNLTSRLKRKGLYENQKQGGGCVSKDKAVSV